MPRPTPLSDAGFPRPLPPSTTTPAPLSALDELLAHCPPWERAWAEEVLELPPAARGRRCAAVLFGGAADEATTDHA